MLCIGPQGRRDAYATIASARIVEIFCCLTKAGSSLRVWADRVARGAALASPQASLVTVSYEPTARIVTLTE
jgi:hypothetical protein